MNLECLVYQYVVGGLVFLAGLVLAWQSGSYSWKRAEDRATALALAFIFLFYFSGHLAWHVLALGG